MNRRFENRVVVITGSAGGLGRTSAEKFAREGAELVLLDINEEGLEETAAILRKEGAKCVLKVIDLVDEDAMNEVGRALCRQFPKIHVLYNNAGAHLGESTRMVDEVDKERWLHYLTINSISPLLLAKSLRPSLSRAKGVILNQSSMASYVPATVYGVTKATLNSLTYGMAHVFARDGIRVNAIAPGIMETPANKEGLSEEKYASIQRLQLIDIPGTAEDIANLAAFLASDDARFITCEIVSCDAGSSLRGWRG